MNTSFEPHQRVNCAAILAGGLSSRMGTEKALLEWQNEPLVARAARVLRPLFLHLVIVTPKAEVARAAGLATISDAFPGRGPLAGIHAALCHFRAPTFVVACDMPFLNAKFIQTLRDNFHAQALVPVSGGQVEPLHAIYAPECLPVFEKYLSAGDKMPSLHRILDELDVRWQTDTQGADFSNWNSPDDVKTRR